MNPHLTVSPTLLGQWELFLTTDTGNTWDSLDNPLNIPDASYFTCGFKNNDTGFVARNSQYFYKTLNGGSTWDSIACQVFNCSEYGFFDMDVKGDQVNLIIANKLYHSDDLGITWEETGEIPIVVGIFPVFSKFSFASAMIGYAVGGDPGFDYGIPFGVINKTTNGGKHWNELNWNYAEDITSADFLNDTVGCVMDYPGSKSIADIDCTTRNCLAVGNAGTILRMESPSGIHNPS